MWAASSASAVKEVGLPLAVSPGNRFIFIANIAMRVRLSLLNFTVEVSANGPSFKVTDSTATARVEAESLIKTGALVAACTAPKAPHRTTRKVALMTLKTLGVRGRLVFIGWALR